MKTIKERAKEAVIDPLDPDEMLPGQIGISVCCWKDVDLFQVL